MEDAPHIQPMGDSAFVVRFGDIISLELHARVVGALRALGAARQSWVVDPRLFSPRLPTPRMAVPAGSMGIGGQQTGIYLTTIQDLGRPGLGRWGVSPCGAMDPLAVTLANLLVGNRADVAALEVTALGPELVFEEDATFALMGAELSARLDETPMATGQAHRARAGQVLRFGARARGASLAANRVPSSRIPMWRRRTQSGSPREEPSTRSAFTETHREQW